MIHLTLKNKNLLAFGIVLLAAFSVASYTLGAITGPKYNFYNPEGDAIPYGAVDSLVRSQFMDRDFSKEGRDTVERYFPDTHWHYSIHQLGDKQYVALVIDNTDGYFQFIKPHEGRFQSSNGDTSLLQDIGCLDSEQMLVSTKDSAEMAIDRWKKIYNRK